jgi:hypothetical protein
VKRLAFAVLVVLAGCSHKSTTGPARVEECVRAVEAAFIDPGTTYSRMIEKYGSQSGEATVFKDHNTEYQVAGIKLGGPQALQQVDPEVRTECASFYGGASAP